MLRSGAALVTVAVLFTACSASQSSPAAPTALPTQGVSATATATGSPATSSPEPKPPDLSVRPLVWFAPLPPLPTGPGRPYTGSDDFMELFAPGAAWERAAARVQVFKLYGEWVAYEATDAELRAAVADIARRGMALAVEMGPLNASPTCGQGVESFAGIDEGRRITGRIRAAGGTLQVIALDEPYYFAHVYGGSNACRWPVNQVATAVADFVTSMRADWPGLVVGDTEPMPTPVTADGLSGWMDAYRAAAGEPLAFLHLDMDWARAEWPSLGLAVRRAGTARSVPVGMIYNGGAATSDAQWAAVAGTRVLAFEADGRPDHVLFQSWMDKPDHVLPESDPTTFTALINRYFDDRGTLAQAPGGQVNLALGKRATASSSVDGSTPDRAIDGDGDTIWSSGTGPQAWIQIDLGASQRVSEIRLTVSQYPDGTTHHRVSCASSAGGARIVLADLSGATTDLQVLTVQLEAPVSCRLLRVDTLASPSWVAWREIEVLAPP